MNTITVLIVTVVLILPIGLYAWRGVDRRSDRREAERLLATQTDAPLLYTKSMVKDLPDPARRYFNFAIKEGTPLYTVAEISMRGRFAMGNKASPNYCPMTAQQVLAAPEGSVWKMSSGGGAIRVSGSDSARWTRFWLAEVLPVARAGGTEDHALSGCGRYVSEAIFWTPAAVLPLENVVWEGIDANTARMTINHNGKRQSVDLSVDPDGRPFEVTLQRWSNANPAKEYRFQPFGGCLSEFRTFSGFQLPTHVEAGNMFGTDDYFPFFIADVSDVRFGLPNRPS